MNNVIELKRSEPEEKWLEGKAMCVECSHKWEAVAPVGTTLFDCPECGTHKGAWVGIVEPPGDRWECNHCEGQLFFVTRTGFFCAKCGVEQAV